MGRGKRKKTISKHKTPLSKMGRFGEGRLLCQGCDALPCPALRPYFLLRSRIPNGRRGKAEVSPWKERRETEGRVRRGELFQAGQILQPEVKDQKPEVTKTNKQTRELDEQPLSASSTSASRCSSDRLQLLQGQAGLRWGQAPAHKVGTIQGPCRPRKNHGTTSFYKRSR